MKSQPTYAAGARVRVFAEAEPVLLTSDAVPAARKRDPDPEVLWIDGDGVEVSGSYSMIEGPADVR